MSNIKTQSFASTREKLGLSQSQLAEYLGVSKSTIGMAETGKRSLPVDALLKYAQLEIKMVAVAIADATPAPGDLLTKLHCPQLATMREIECDIQRQRLTIKLEAMVSKHKKFAHQLYLLDEMLVKNTSNPLESSALFLSVSRQRIMEQLKTCNIPEQMLLQNRIAVLGAEINLSRSVRQKFS